MADIENDNEGQRTKQLLEQANKELLRFGMVTSSTAAALKKATAANAAAIKKNTKTKEDEAAKLKKKQGQMLKAVGQVGSAANKIRQNRDSFESLNPAIKMTGAVLGKAGKAMGSGLEQAGSAASEAAKYAGKMGGIVSMAGGALSLLGKGLSGASEAASQLAVQFGEFATKELQGVVDAYRKVGTVGAIGAKGMTGLYDQAVEAGLSIANFSTLINENGSKLAYAYGNTADGAAAMAKIGKESMEYRQEMLNLGVSITDQRKYQMEFSERNALLGIADAKDAKSMAQASRQYMEELDLLSRVTGKSKEEMAKKLESDQANARWLASKAAIEAKYGIEGVQKLELAAAQVEKMYGPEMAAAYRDSVFNATTDAAQKGAFATGGTMTANIDRMMKSKLSVADAADESVMGIGESLQKTFTGLDLENIASVSGGNDNFDVASKALLQSRNILEDNRHALRDAAKAQEALKNTTDQNTKSTTEAAVKMNDMGIALDKMVKDKVLPIAATSINKFASTLNEAVDAMTEALGLKMPTVGSGSDVSDAWSGAVGTGTGGYGGTGGAGGGGEKTGPTAPITTGTTQQVLDTIKQKESGGNYQAQAKGSSASGAYQFTDSTWKDLTKKHGIGQEFARAKDAPPEIQDMIAKLHAEKFLKQAGGDIAGVAKGWYTGNIQGQMSAQALAANRGMTADMYAADFQKKFAAMGAKNPALYADNRSASSVTAGQVAATAGAEQKVAKQEPVKVPAGRPGSPSYNKAHEQEMARLDAQEATANKQIAEANKARGTNTQIASLPSGLPMGRPGSPSYNAITQQMAEEKIAPEYQARIDQAQRRKAALTAKMMQPTTEVTAANGGVFSGPKSGYAATLHGSEAVVPVDEKKSVPVESKAIMASAASDQQLQLMTAQSSKLEQLLRIMSQTASTSESMLRAAT